MNWRINNQLHALTHRAMVMGIVNVTPDSFSDGGQFVDVSQAVEHALRLVSEGANIIDIGGESTRPGAEPVSEDEELRRVLPVIEALRSQTQALISIDTFKAAVAREAVKAGADIINDITGLRGDPDMMEVVASSDAGVVIMHMQGMPRTMQQAPHYEDVVGEVRGFFEERLGAIVAAGIHVERVVLDPGIGFGKKLEHNIALIRATSDFLSLGRPLLIGASRKSFISQITGSKAMNDRFWPTVAITSLTRELGAMVHRVHDTAPCHQALRMTEAILHGVPT
ncbi:MAG: dihydropteroate synthase [Verrucomicrobiaceae bacterium]|nr:dihydropteroate synthase [Verrucomicrobiaceae bacterium]